jgi:hypothetical protein
MTADDIMIVLISGCTAIGATELLQWLAGALF